MNIISNCCLGGELYKRVYKTQYTNPFIWSMMPAEDLLYLIQNYSKINFHDYTLLPVEQEDYFKIIVNNVISIIYPHYHYKDCELIKNNVDVYDRNIKTYIVDKYISRLHKMENEATEPEFWIITYTKYQYNYTFENTKKIINALKHYKYKYKIITQYYSISKTDNNIIYDKSVANTKKNYPLNLLRNNKDKLNLSKFFF